MSEKAELIEYEIENEGVLRKSIACKYDWAPGLLITNFTYIGYEVTVAKTGHRLTHRHERFGMALDLLAKWVLIGKTYGVDWSAEIDARKLAEEIFHKECPWAEGAGKIIDWKNITMLRSLDGVLPEFPWEDDESSPWASAEEVIEQILETDQ